MSNEDCDPRLHRYWLSCSKFTVGITVKGTSEIVEAAPIVKRFIGQHPKALADWMRKIGGFEGKRLR